MIIKECSGADTISIKSSTLTEADIRAYIADGVIDSGQKAAIKSVVDRIDAGTIIISNN